MGKTIQEIKLGEKASTEKTISESDVYLFAGITGDLNPAHVSQVAAEKSIFGSRIAHGILVSGLISKVLGMQLPGPGTIYLSQNLKFVAPVKFGDTITAEAEVTEIMAEKNRVRLKTICTNQDGRTVISGEAVVMPPQA